MTIPLLPAAPNPSDAPAQFDALAFGFASALEPWGQAVDAVGQQVADDAAAAVSAKDLAEAARDTAVAAASAAESLAGASEWVSGTTYAAGDAVWSPIDYRTYRRKTPGAGTTDPSVDPTNWAPVVAQGDVTGPAGAADGHVAVFDGVDGSTLKDGGKALPAGAVVGTTDTQTLTGKTISYADNTLSGVQPTLVSGTHVRTVAGKSIVGAGNVELARADVGLGNVDNTSDAAKPISTATQAALNGKANVSHTHAIANITGLQTALDGKISANSELFRVQAEDIELVGSLLVHGVAEFNYSARFDGPVEINSSVKFAAVNLNTDTDLDLSTGVYFFRSMNVNTSFSVSNEPTAAVVFFLGLNYSGGSLTLPSGYSWAGGAAPTLSTGYWLIRFFRGTLGGATMRIASAQKMGA